MANKYITAIILTVLAAGNITAQTVDRARVARLVVGIAIDNLSAEELEEYMPRCGDDGLKSLLSQGILYTTAELQFAPADCASALATLHTGAAPSYNGIVAGKWFDRSTLREVSATEDPDFKGILTDEYTSAGAILTTTLSDELKVATNGKAIVYSIAEDREAAVLPAGHNADGAFWINKPMKRWCSSTYYFKSAPKWLEAYNTYNTQKLQLSISDQITDMALQCLSAASMGKDDATDMLLVAYTATPQAGKAAQEDSRLTYTQLDKSIARLIKGIRSQTAAGDVLFFITGASHDASPRKAESQLRLPGGTFYVNRTANLLNMYLSALYGSGQYVEGYSANQIYLNKKLTDQKRLNTEDLCTLAKSFIRQSAGVRNVYSAESLMQNYSPELSHLRNGFCPSRSGDLIIEVSPGWNITNEDTGQTNYYSIGTPSVPVIICGQGIKSGKVTTPVAVERISPTIAKAIRIRAPNACSQVPLF